MRTRHGWPARHTCTGVSVDLGSPKTHLDIKCKQGQKETFLFLRNAKLIKLFRRLKLQISAITIISTHRYKKLRNYLHVKLKTILLKLLYLCPKLQQLIYKGLKVQQQNKTVTA